MTEQEILAGAEARIERYRKADAVVRVVDSKGAPLSDATVRVEQVRHTFLFGCNAYPLFTYDTPEKEMAYENQFAALFNYATLPFYWASYEPEPGNTKVVELERVARWCKEHGIIPKGHPLVWHEMYPAWAPSEVEETRAALEKRVTDIVANFSGLIDYWDVVNEATTSGKFGNGMGRWAQENGTPALVAAALGWAHSANPKAFLLYNDYYLGEDYELLARSLVSFHRPVDAFGIQSHMHRGEWSLERAWETCETYSRFGKPLHFTELTVLSGEQGYNKPLPWPSTPEGEAHQADYVEKLYTVLFSHPAVQAITWWDFMDGGWMGAPGGLVRADLTPKPVYDRLLKLIKGKWWTRAELATDAEGKAAFRGFLGHYKVTVTTPTETKTQEMDLRRDADNAVTVEMK